MDLLITGTGARALTVSSRRAKGALSRGRAEIVSLAKVLSRFTILFETVRLLNVSLTTLLFAGLGFESAFESLSVSVTGGRVIVSDWAIAQQQVEKEDNNMNSSFFKNNIIRAKLSK